MSEDRKTRIKSGDKKSARETEQSESTLCPKQENETANSNEDRIQERLCISVPAAKPVPRPKPFWRRYLGAKVLLELKDGIEISGILREILFDWIRLENVLEVGKNHRVSADWIMIDASSVSRFYPGNAHFE
jgi:hypothetical protein